MEMMAKGVFATQRMKKKPKPEKKSAKKDIFNPPIMGGALPKDCRSILISNNPVSAKDTPRDSEFKVRCKDDIPSI